MSVSSRVSSSRLSLPPPFAAPAGPLICLAFPAALEQEFAAGLALITPERRARTLRLRRREDALACLTAGLLLRRVLGVVRDADLPRGPQGKPFPADGRQCGLSYGRGLVALSVGILPHGLDIEAPAPFRPFAARRCLTPEEWSLLQEAADPANLFCRLWSGKESLLKADGRGLSLSPAAVSLLPLENPLKTVDGRRWRLRQWFAAGHWLSLARREEDGEPRRAYLSVPELLRPGDPRCFPSPDEGAGPSDIFVPEQVENTL